ncbi:MAG: chemotaxis protein CheD [Spirochaetales bacterium]|nr:chemotaxis protein CheD [Spirochaetales bacterium]
MRDTAAGNRQYYLKPGYIYISLEAVEITTVLGSCVAVCLFDGNLQFGGMNHYLLAKKPAHGETSSRYGDVSIGFLIKSFLEYGSKLRDLSARIIGGAYMRGNNDSKRISEDNVNIAELMLNKYGIRIVSRVVGGVAGRKITFDSWNDQVRISTVNEVKSDEFMWVTHGTD